MAPEVINGYGHGKAVDYWGLGILIYELLTGNCPFTGKTPLIIYDKILNINLKYPIKYFNESALKICKRLIQNEPTQRLGNLKNGIKDIKTHDWFSTIDWEKL